MATSTVVPSLRTEERTITPFDAKGMLDRTPSQFRRLNKDRAMRIAEHIKADRWEFNGETIKIAPDGSVVDGQHRLYACVLANRSIRSIVVYNVKRSIHVDTGKSRSSGEHLAYRGESNATTLAAVAKFQWLYEKDNLMLSGDRAVASPEEILDVVSRHAGLQSAIKVARKCDKVCNITPVAFAYYHFSQKDPVLADQFVESLASGANLGDSDSVKVLRDNLMRNQKKTIKMTSLHKLALIIKAWNAWRNNKTVSNLAWRRVGPSPEAFPDIE